MRQHVATTMTLAVEEAAASEEMQHQWQEETLARAAPFAEITPKTLVFTPSAIEQDAAVPLLALAVAPTKLSLPVTDILVTWDELPIWLRDNEFILTGFRPASNSYRASVRSLAYLHNQTGNIYSHALAAIATAALGIWLLRHARGAQRYPSAGAEDWLVFGAFFVGAAVCCTLSALFHTFANHSRAGHGLWLRMDFLGILAVTAGAFVPSLWYTPYCRSRELKSFWITLELCSQLAGAVFTLFVPAFRTPRWRPVRACMFIVLASSGFFPIIHATYTYGLARMVVEGGATYHALAALFYMTGAVVYATRWPEKWAPGKYDTWGHSHQLFHVLVVMGLGAHLAAFATAFDYAHRLGSC